MIWIFSPTAADPTSAVPDTNARICPLGRLAVIAKELSPAMLVGQLEPDLRILRFAGPDPCGTRLGLLGLHRVVKADGIHRQNPVLVRDERDRACKRVAVHKRLQRRSDGWQRLGVEQSGGDRVQERSSEERAAGKGLVHEGGVCRRRMRRG